MIVLVLMLLLAGPSAADAQTIRASITVSPEAAGAVAAVPALQGGLQRLFDIRYGSLVSLAFDAAPPVTTVTPAESAARVVLGLSGGVITVSTELDRARATRSLVSTVPAASPASLLATISGDIAFLYFSSRGFPSLPLSAPPPLAASVSTDTLASLTGWNAADLEPVACASWGDDVTVVFPHRYLTLGPLLGTTPATIRDIVAQAGAREPLQLSGAVTGNGDRLVLLSERDGRMAVVNPRLGTRRVVEAPGLSGLSARLLGGRIVASLSGAAGGPGLRLYSTEGGPPRGLDVGASYVPAFDRDAEGNLWLWDAGERRVRVIAAGGREVFSIRPLFSAATMQLPQQLAVFDDGSFVLGGSAEVWKFQSSGVPVWRLTRIPGRPAESLPSAFALAVNRSSGSVTILDPQSRRLLAFSAAGAAGAAGAAAAAAGPPTEGSGAARAAMLAAKAAGLAAFAEGLARDLLYERADAAYLKAAETLRELTAESPDDEEAAGLLRDVAARRREVRAALLGAREVQVTSARVVVVPGGGCGGSGMIEVRIRNSGPRDLAGIRVHVNVPALEAMPSLAEVASLPALRESLVRVLIGPVDGEALPPAGSVPAFALITADRGTEGITAALSFTAQLPVDATRGDAARALACRAAPQDALAASLPGFLLAGAVPEPPQPLADLAGVLDVLGAERRAGEVQPLPGTVMRAVLRGVSGDEAAWTVVTASIASSLGLPSAILTAAGRPLALVDTRVPFFSALSMVPELQRHGATLARLSPGGTLWMPLSGRAAPAGTTAAAWSFKDAMELLEGNSSAEWRRSGLPSSPDHETTASPFPLVLPGIAARPSLGVLRDAISAAAGGLSR